MKNKTKVIEEKKEKERNLKNKHIVFRHLKKYKICFEFRKNTSTFFTDFRKINTSINYFKLSK